MNTNERELLLKKEVYAIVGAAMDVSNELGAGFLEAVYQEALEMELTARAIPYVAQPTIHVTYKGQILQKNYMPDFLCFNQVIVEIKAAKELAGNDDAQVLNYLKATDKSVGLLFNFGTPKLEWKRLVLSQNKLRTFE